MKPDDVDVSGWAVLALIVSALVFVLFWGFP